MNLITCLNCQNVIGLDNTIPWHLSSDLKRFKQLTNGHIVVMGRKTYDSLPIKPLRNRINVVITRYPEYYQNQSDLYFIDLKSSVRFLKKLQKTLLKEIFIIGGSSIYNYFFKYCDIFYITKIYNECKGNVYFPFHYKIFENHDNFQLLNVPLLLEEKNIYYTFLDFKKIK